MSADGVIPRSPDTTHRKKNILEQASPLIQELFKGAIGPVAAGGFVTASCVTFGLRTNPTTGQRSIMLRTLKNED
jgi:hypothetical protein